MFRATPARISGGGWVLGGASELQQELEGKPAVTPFALAPIFEVELTEIFQCVFTYLVGLRW